MKTFVLPALKLTLVFIVILAIAYPFLIAGIGKLAPGQGKGLRIIKNGKTIGYENVGQKFTHDNYFNDRPSAASFNAAGSAGSNKGPSNPDYLKDVQAKIDTFLKHNPGIKKSQIPSELVTYSGSGLDPDLSPDAAMIQVTRVANVRGLKETTIRQLVTTHIEPPFLGLFGPAKVNVLKLNLALDQLK